MSSSVIRQLKGRAVPVRGNDIDTDRIIPARFMKTVSFDSLGQHVFHDARRDSSGKPAGPPLRRSPPRGGRDPAGQPQLRLRLLPRARPAGAGRLGHPGGGGGIPGGDLRG